MRRSRSEGRKGPIFELPVGEDVARELAFHVEMRTRELIAEGWEPAAARAEALRLFGDVEGVSAECRAITTSSDRSRARSRLLEDLWADLRFAVRGLRRSPGFLAVAIVTLGLGIGANTAIFSVVNGILLQPLPYPDSDRIVRVRERHGPGGRTVNQAGFETFLDWKASARSFQQLAAYQAVSSTVLGADRPIRVGTAAVTADFFRLFRVQPALGRPLRPDEFLPGADPAALVSQRFWRTHLGSAPDLDAEHLKVRGLDLRVVGVMPPGFDFPDDADVWFPLELLELSRSRTGHNYRVVGRLAGGVTVRAAEGEMNALARRLSEQYPEYDDSAASVMRLQDTMTGPVRRPLWLLLAAAGLVLLVACTNVASTLLARGTARGREIAIRASLGADRLRVVRQLFTESLVLGALGCAAGLVVATLALGWLVGLGPDTLPRLDAVHLDGRVLAFAVAVAFLTAVIFGAFPAIRASGRDVRESLRSGSRGNAADRRGRAWSLLVGAEVALAIVLLVGSGLLIRSFRQLLSVDPGFDPRGVLTVDLSLPNNKYPFADPAASAFYRDLLGQLAEMPGVEAVGMINDLPLSGSDNDGTFVIREGGADLAELLKRNPETICDEVRCGDASYRVASAGYFEAMGIPLLRGRLFEAQDNADAPDAVVINRTMAERYWPDEDPVGKQFDTAGMDTHYDRWATIVGVVGDVRHRGLAEPPEPEYYVHYLQRSDRTRDAVVAIRVQGRPGALAGPIREQLRRIDPDVPARFAPMESRLAESLANRRFVMVVLGAFAALALVLAAVGIYGVVSYTVARRSREVGIRIALGAEPARVRDMVIRQSMSRVLVGAALGLAAALALTRVLRTLLYGVSPTDPVTFVTVALVLAAAAWLASYVPARRTTRVDPIITMRAE